MGAQRRRRHPGAGRGARDLLQSITRLKQLSGLERTDEGKRAATATKCCTLKDGLAKKRPILRRKTMRKQKVGAIAIKSLALLVVLGTAYQAMAQDAKTAYPSIAPIEQYLMDRTAEIALARSAAPESISGDAEVLVLGRHGFETAVKDKNCFVCIVKRS